MIYSSVKVVNKFPYESCITCQIAIEIYMIITNAEKTRLLANGWNFLYPNFNMLWHSENDVYDLVIVREMTVHYINKACLAARSPRCGEFEVIYKP